MTSNMLATSLLELLTYPNPTIKHERKGSKTNSRNPQWLVPKKAIKWDEFEDFSVLEDAFGGHLLREARRGGRELRLPKIRPDIDCRVGDEKKTRMMIEKWTKEIVTAALDPIQHTYHPVIWDQGDPPSDDKPSSSPRRPSKKRNQPSRQCSRKARGSRKISLKRLVPDSGSVDRTPPLPGHHPRPPHSRVEKFPKEYKPAFKWNSKGFEDEVVHDDGTWDDDESFNNYALPVRQAYTYCIQNMCRYGCIITCDEAFIFRVSPLENNPDSSDQEALRRVLTGNGLIEYVSISWKRQREGDLKEHDFWTVNLALWFVHILAGNSYEANWTYRRLREETLSISEVLGTQVDSMAESAQGDGANIRRSEQEQDDEGSETDDARTEIENVSSSDSEQSDLIPSSRVTRRVTKRKREKEEEDEKDRIFHSFVED